MDYDTIRLRFIDNPCSISFIESLMNQVAT